MPTPRSGFFYNASGNNFVAPTLGNSNFTPKLPIGSFRVKDIILDETHDKFNNLGGWNSIGVIFVEPVSTIQRNQNNISISFAYPLFPNIKHYPLINEIVPLIYLADSTISENPTSVIAYYLPPINIWNTQIHNATPSFNPIPDTQKKDYQQIEAGSISKPSFNPTDISLGKTFNDLDIISNPLYPFEGDVIYEGRFGNSIRLGSTVDNAFHSNPWSDGSKNGNPIMILRNGQDPSSATINDMNSGQNSWVPILEDVNLDKSSIYLTSMGRIPLVPSCLIQTSFFVPYFVKNNITPPTLSSDYSEEQIILTSNRLVFNAKKESIILQAGNIIHLTANKSVNIDGGDTISIVAPKVYLGIPLGEENIQTQAPVMGNNLHSLLEDISNFLDSLSFACKTAVDSNGAAIVSLNVLANDASNLSDTIKNTIDSKRLLSKNIKIS
jgi:hypothetical protein